ncbi:MAG: apolipoprotein N-acyltransferase [Verrucomicrobia bacterium]|nr:apolipoprotein N-acyltransferase [Verrucomicrobiota bacterium]
MKTSGISGLRIAPWRWICAALSGGLMFAAFPPLEWSACAWVALIPLFWAVRGLDPRHAVRPAFVAGAVFWLPSLFWVGCVTWAGWAILSLYCALYTIPPAMVFAWLQSGRVRAWPASRLLLLVASAAAWVGWEHLRGVLFTGFAWNFIGVSQHANPLFAQHAEWGGAAAVSALVVWVNAAGVLVLEGFAVRGGLRQTRPEVAFGFLVMTAAAFGGWRMLARLPEPDGAVRLGLVQPAIPQYEKWTEEFWDAMYGRLGVLSRAALHARPDLVVWPETAVPDNLRDNEGVLALVAGIVSNGVPLLAGGIDTSRTDDGELLSFNTSYLIGPGPAIRDTYDKQHLVLFGEFVPFARWLPALRRLTPIEYDVSPGRRSTVFRLARPGTAFSAMICFEDTIASMARRFVRDGARFLIVQTNDAWFDGTWGPRQHMIQSVFRAIETRTPLVRCGNSGVTCWIDPAGRIGGAGGERTGSLPVMGSDGRPASGFLTVEVPFHSTAPAEPTFFLRHGPVFGWAMALLAVLLFIPAWRMRDTADIA